MLVVEGALCRTSDAAAVPESASVGWTFWTPTAVGLLTAKAIESVSPGSRPGGTVRVALNAASTTKVIGFHCRGPKPTGELSTTSVPPPPPDARVAVAGAVPFTVHWNARVAPAGTSWATGADTTVTLVVPVSVEGRTPIASEPPSLSTSSESWIGRFTATGEGTGRGVAVRCEGSAMITVSVDSAGSGRASTWSAPRTGSVSSSVPAAEATTRQVKTWAAPAGMSTTEGETWTTADGPFIEGVPGATWSA